MAAQDKQGRPYAKLSELRGGETVELDSGFPCHAPGKVQLFGAADGRLFFWCNGPNGESKDAQQHDLVGQDDGDGCCVGIYKLANTAEARAHAEFAEHICPPDCPEHPPHPDEYVDRETDTTGHSPPTK